METASCPKVRERSKICTTGKILMEAQGEWGGVRIGKPRCRSWSWKNNSMGEHSTDSPPEQNLPRIHRRESGELQRRGGRGFCSRERRKDSCRVVVGNRLPLHHMSPGLRIKSLLPSQQIYLLQSPNPSPATNGHHDGLGEEKDTSRRARVGGGRAGRPPSRYRLPDRRRLPHPRQWPLPRLPHLLPALQGAARGGVGASGGIPGQHRRPRCLRVPPGRRGAAQHQPPPAGRARRPRARGGPPRQPRQDHPGVGGEAVEGGAAGGGGRGGS